MDIFLHLYGNNGLLNELGVGERNNFFKEKLVCFLNAFPPPPLHFFFKAQGEQANNSILSANSGTCTFGPTGK